ncbi:hypothetical protein BYT27DRAFT_7341372 [Phlegmacium glaucopus]|nr:hypothetical protein BYT27DRAFT_7341372 [Phlegmacium glaucopus]
MPTLDDAELPSYTRVQTQQSPISGSVHERYLGEGKYRKWLSLSVKSSSRDAGSMPVFFEDDDISGQVEVDLEKAESIKGVTISIQGGTTFVGQDHNIFLQQTQTLWTPTAENGSKLKGKHSWPFSFVLKHEVLMKDDKKNETIYRIPPNLTERASPVYIDYKLVVTVHRGMWNFDQTLLMNLGYLPKTFPDPPSELRRLAYTEDSQLIGPDGDPEGWKILAPVKVKGTLFRVKQVEVKCTCAIALPLSYAIGSAIPVIITLTGDDEQVLDVLGNPSAIRLRLVRSMATGSKGSHFQVLAGQAYFWDSKEGGKEVNKRVLQGELELVKTLKPSFKFPNITISVSTIVPIGIMVIIDEVMLHQWKYTMELLPFEAAGFVEAANEGKDPVLLSEQVTLTTRQIPGLITRSYAPPGYERPPQEVNYGNSVGFLLNTIGGKWY